MNKTELIESVTTDVSSQLNISKNACGVIVNSVLEQIKNANQRGEDVMLVGFGTFTVGKRAARTGRNPQTGKAIKIAACNYPKFRPGKAYKQAVNSKPAKAAKPAAKKAKKK